MVITGLILGAYGLGRQATRTQTLRPSQAQPATIVARAGELEETRPVQVQAHWQIEGKLVGRLAGTVTSVGLPPGTATNLEEGTIVYAVDARPVIAIAAAQPAYRAIEFGTKGTDVEQIQKFLVRQGANLGEVDGKWGNATITAWKAWRRANNLPETSTISLGEVIFVPELPRRVVPGEALTPGGVVSGSETIADELAPEPTFSIDVPGDAAGNLTSGLVVDIDIGGRSVSARVSDRRAPTELGNVRIELDLPAPGCVDWCDDIPAERTSEFRGVAHLSPLVKGTIVPIGALRTGTGDGSAVVLADGTTVGVTVLARVGSEAVVDGIEAGDRIQLPGAPTTVTTP